MDGKGKAIAELAWSIYDAAIAEGDQRVRIAATVIPVKYACVACGSDDLLHDAWAGWNEDAQRFEVSSVHDMTRCNACDGEAKTVTVPIAGYDRFLAMLKHGTSADAAAAAAFEDAAAESNEPSF